MDEHRNMNKKEFFNFDKGIKRLTGIACFLSILPSIFAFIAGVGLLLDPNEDYFVTLLGTLFVLGYIWILYLIVRFIFNGFRDTEKE